MAKKKAKQKIANAKPVETATSHLTSRPRATRKAQKGPAKEIPTTFTVAADTGPFKTGFPIVGIGASAGGLEALTELLKNMPAETGLAFVVVTHQHSGRTSMLSELLAKASDMPVHQVMDGAEVRPNHVYVAPPGCDLANFGGTLHRIEPERVDPPRLPIDYFFRSLAEDQKEKAICVILSGAATDGTLGLREIKAQSGMAMVERPQSARYAGMPSNAIATGLVDYVLPPATLPAMIVLAIEDVTEKRGATVL